MDFIVDNLDKALTVIGAASIIATVTPTKKDDTLLGYLSAFVHFMAMNFGRAKK